MTGEEPWSDIRDQYKLHDRIHSIQYTDNDAFYVWMTSTNLGSSSQINWKSLATRDSLVNQKYHLDRQAVAMLNVVRWRITVIDDQAITKNVKRFDHLKNLYNFWQESIGNHWYGWSARCWDIVRWRSIEWHLYRYPSVNSKQRSNWQRRNLKIGASPREHLWWREAT